MTHATKEIRKEYYDPYTKYENGEMSPRDVVKFFSKLIKSGEAYRLQGFYGRQAEALIKAGYISHKGKILIKGSERDEKLVNEVI